MFSPLCCYLTEQSIQQTQAYGNYYCQPQNATRNSTESLSRGIPMIKAVGTSDEQQQIPVERAKEVGAVAPDIIQLYTTTLSWTLVVHRTSL